MSREPRSASGLAGGLVISLRPVGGHAALRRAAAAHGARVLALSPWRIAFPDAAPLRAALRAALAAPRVIVTSPNAARALHALAPALRVRRGQRWIAVGAGTAAALRRIGITDIAVPERMDSDGVLALPELHARDATPVALLTAPGGRDRIAPALRARGVDVRRVDVYARVPIAPSPRAIAALRALDATPWLMLSSGEALAHVLAALPADAAARLRRARVSAASERLADAARAHGFRGTVVIAADARPRSLIAAAVVAGSRAPRRSASMPTVPRIARP